MQVVDRVELVTPVAGERFWDRTNPRVVSMVETEPGDGVLLTLEAGRTVHLYPANIIFTEYDQRSEATAEHWCDDCKRAFGSAAGLAGHRVHKHAAVTA